MSSSPRAAAPLVDSDSSLTERDRTYLLHAQRVAKQSHDPRAQEVERSGVGAVIVSGDRVISESANQLPRALERLVELVTRADREHLIEHAERGALYKAWKAGRRLDGATMYCTRFPCSDCARAVIIAGVGRLVVGRGFSKEGEWKESQRNALRMLRLAGVTVRYMDTEDGGARE